MLNLNNVQLSTNFLFLESHLFKSSTDILTFLGRLCLHMDSLETGEETKRLLFSIIRLDIISTPFLKSQEG